MGRYLIAFGSPASLSEVDFSERAVVSWAPTGAGYAVQQPPGSCFKMLCARNASRNFSLSQRGHEDLLVLIDGCGSPRFFPGSSTRSSATPAEHLATHYLETGKLPVAMQRESLAAVIVDGRKQTALATRDFFGRRPLYFAELHANLFISNDLQLISAVPGIGRALNPVAIADFLRYGLLDFFDKALTPFKKVCSLPPARLLVGSAHGRHSVTRFAAFSDLLQGYPTPRPNQIPAVFAEVFGEAVDDSVRDRRILLSLSGGLDSGAIAACAASALAGDVRERMTAVTGLSGPDDPEAEYSSLTASHLGLRHQFTWLRREHVLADTPPTWYPNMNLHDQSGDSDWNAALDNHDVALIGAAGDSVLCPEHSPVILLLRKYGIRHACLAFREAARAGRNLGLGSGLRRWLGGQPERSAARIGIPFDVPAWMNEELVSEFRLTERWQSHAQWQPDENLHPTHPQAQLWLQWANWSFSGGNIDSRSPELEMVDPFLDWRVISFCFSIPPEPWMHRKKILRMAFRDRLPERILQRPKSPAGNYVIKYLEELERDRLDGWSLAPELAGFLRRELVPRFSPDLEARNGYLNLRPLMLQRWFDGLSRW